MFRVNHLLMKFQALFLSKSRKDGSKLAAAAVVIVAFKVKGKNSLKESILSK